MRRLLLLVLVAGSAALGFVPLAQASDGTLAPTAESWYQPNPSCATPAGCVTTDTLPAALPAPVPTSPFPAGTMHIGYAASTETARSYLVFGLDSLTGTLTGAQLDVPLDVAPADGDLQSSTAQVQVCLATGAISVAEGSINVPPGVDCASHVPMTYVATPAPHLHADLAPLLLDLPATTGIALLPDPTKAGQTDAWHVVFSAHDRADAAKTPPATLSVTLSDEPVDATPEQPAVDLPDPVVPPVDSGVAPSPPLAAVGELPRPTGVGTPQVSVPQTPVSSPRTITVGYAYPGVWLLPLALLVVVPLATRALTQDLSPARPT